MRFRKKPVVIDAFRWTGRNAGEVMRWRASFAGVSRWRFDSGPDYAHLFIDTLEGEMLATAGDWIIRGVKGEFYPCKPDIFEATYEPVPPVRIVPIEEEKG